MFSIFDRAAEKTKAAIIYFSCGKDSVVLLDMAVKKFESLSLWFMYLVKDLSFQEEYLQFVERKYRVTINRIPHWQLGRMLRNAVYRPRDNVSAETPALSIKDIDAHVRAESGLEWILSGEKGYDSMVRRAMLKRCRGIDEKRRRIFPLTTWNDAAIWRYIKKNRLPISRDYRMFGQSFGRLWVEELAAIDREFPEDFKKIEMVFPYVRAAIKRKEFATSH